MIRPKLADLESGKIEVSSQQPIDLTARNSPERARVRKYSILHPDAPLSCAALDVSEHSAAAQCMNFEDVQFEAQVDSFVANGSCDALEHQVDVSCAGFSLQNAAEIASVFLEVVHHASSKPPMGSTAMEEAAKPCRPYLKYRYSKENKDSKKQLASIIKMKSCTNQPLEEYQAARFAKRMQM
jgi:uncharacterized protein YsxB (DUF464 family)